MKPHHKLAIGAVLCALLGIALQENQARKDRREILELQEEIRRLKEQQERTPPPLPRPVYIHEPTPLTLNPEGIDYRAAGIR